MKKNNFIKSVKISDSIIYDNSFIYVQSMCSFPYSKMKELENQIIHISNTNCSLIRLSIRNDEEISIAKSLKEKYEKDDFIFVADTHFSPIITIKSIKNCFKKVRINPGNMDFKQMQQVAKVAKDYDATLRIGLNGGSINEKIKYKNQSQYLNDLVSLFESYIEPFEKENFNKIVLSAKFSDYKLAIKVNEALYKKFNYPIHLGVTEAGGIIRSTILHTLFLENMFKKGIGSTVRISITGDSQSEIDTANEILKSLGIYRGIDIISCPTCGRTWGDLSSYVKEFSDRIKPIEYQFLKKNKMPDKSIKCAIMGCEVNGPGEARDADFGVSLAKDDAVLFSKGQLVERIKKSQIIENLLSLVKGLL